MDHRCCRKSAGIQQIRPRIRRCDDGSREKIEVEPDYAVWKEYAQKEQIHSAVISYLDTRPGSFYKMETTVDGRKFATPRGWEDLSVMLKVYESLGKEIDREVVVQYIQHEVIARDFASYLELYRKYRMDYQLDAVLAGHIDEILLKKAAHAPFDERLGVVNLLLSRCREAFAAQIRREETSLLLYEQLKQLKESLFSEPEQPDEACHTQTCLNDQIVRFSQEYEQKKTAGLLTREEDRQYRQAAEQLEDFSRHLQASDLDGAEEAWNWVNEQFDREQDTIDESFEAAGILLEHAFDFIEAAFGSGQETVIFITSLNTDYYSVRFLRQYNCERYYRYNKELLFEERSRSIEARLKELNR